MIESPPSTKNDSVTDTRSRPNTPDTIAASTSSIAPSGAIVLSSPEPNSGSGSVAVEFAVGGERQTVHNHHHGRHHAAGHLAACGFDDGVSVEIHAVGRHHVPDKRVS